MPADMQQATTERTCPICEIVIAQIIERISAEDLITELAWAEARYGKPRSRIEVMSA